MEYVHGFIEFLKLKQRVDIVLKGRAHKEIAAFYAGVYNHNGDVVRHTVTVYMGNVQTDSRTLETKIAHELIHAAEMEKGLKYFHGSFFRRTAEKMEKEFPQLKRVYIKGLDTKARY